MRFGMGDIMNPPSGAPWGEVIKSFPYQMLVLQNQSTLCAGNVLFLYPSTPLMGMCSVDQEPV